MFIPKNIGKYIEFKNRGRPFQLGLSLKIMNSRVVWYEDEKGFEQ